MFNAIFISISVLCVVLAAAAGYMFATIKAMKAAALAPAPVAEQPAAVPSPEAQPAEAVKPRKTSSSAKHCVGEVNEEGKVWTEYAPGKFGWRSTCSKKEAEKKEVVAEAKTEHKPSTRAKHYAGEVREDGKVFTEYAPGKFGWRAVAGGTKPAAVKPAAPKAKEEKPAAAPVAPVAEQPAAPKAKPVTEHTRAELLEAIKQYNCVNVEKAAIKVKIGKTECTICTINSTCAILNDGREVKLTAVPFSKAILENIIVACSKAVKAAAEKPAAAPVTPVAEQPAAEAPAKPAPKDEAKKDAKDVQPMTDAERYLINQASAIVTVMDNRRIESVSFTDAVKTELTNPKGQKIYAEVLGFNRHNGKVFVAFNDGKKDMAFEFLKAAPRFNRETLCTLLKQINAAVANRKGANANLVPMKSVVA